MDNKIFYNLIILNRGFKMDNPINKKVINVLLVEDNPPDVRMIREIFKEFNTKTKVYNVPNGVEALKFLNKTEKYQKEITPNLILLDLNIPLRDGFEVLEKIKNDENLRMIPTIILTTSTDKEDFLKAQELEADCYITKSIYLEEYSRMLQHIKDCWL